VVAAGSRTPQGQEIVREIGQAVQAEGPVLVNEAEAALAQVQTARQVISTLPQKLFQPMMCTQCARAIAKAFSKQGITGWTMNIRANNGLALIANDLIGGGGSITNNGTHQAIRIGSMVFDNYFPRGVPYSQYVQSLVAPVGLTITEHLF